MAERLHDSGDAYNSTAAAATLGGPTLSTPPGFDGVDVVQRELQTSLVRGYLADAPTMHALPTLYVFIGSFFAVTTLTIFLQTTVIPSSGHVAVFFFGAFTCFSSYYMAAHFLGEHARSFQRISPEKKMYTVSNLIKAGVLAAITPLGVLALWRGMMHDQWDNNILRNLGCIYAIPDFVALLVVRRMATSTYVHHICVLVFCISSLYNDYQEENVIRAMAVYGAFSTFGYVVYMLLATRFLGVSTHLARALSSIALVVYLGCCGINWLWQATFINHLVMNRPHWSVYVYMSAMTLIVYDDLQLCKWLLHRAREHTRPARPARRPASVNAAAATGGGGGVTEPLASAFAGRA